MSTQQLNFSDLVTRTSSRESQCGKILEYLQSGKSITPLESLSLFGCLRLGGRIFDLRKQGHNIESTMVDVGNGKHVAQYRLLNEEKDTQLSIVGGGAETDAVS